jgi:hypothetical protein
MSTRPARTFRGGRYVIGGCAAILTIITIVALWRPWQSLTPSSENPGTVVQHVRSGNLDIVVLSPTGTLHQGRNTFTIEVRSPNGSLVDVGAVRASANMAMPGMVMSGGLQVTRTNVPGRYLATAEFGMAGAWPMTIEWDGPAGHGSVNFQGTVQ